MWLVCSQRLQSGPLSNATLPSQADTFWNKWKGVVYNNIANIFSFHEIKNNTQGPDHMGSQREMNLQAEPNLSSLSTAKYWEERAEATVIVKVPQTNHHTKVNITFDTYVWLGWSLKVEMNPNKFGRFIEFWIKNKSYWYVKFEYFIGQPWLQSFYHRGFSEAVWTCHWELLFVLQPHDHQVVCMSRLR